MKETQPDQPSDEQVVDFQEWKRLYARRALNEERWFAQYLNSDVAPPHDPHPTTWRDTEEEFRFQELNARFGKHLAPKNLEPTQRPDRMPEGYDPDVPPPYDPAADEYWLRRTQGEEDQPPSPPPAN